MARDMGYCGVHADHFDVCPCRSGESRDLTVVYAVGADSLAMYTTVYGKMKTEVAWSLAIKLTEIVDSRGRNRHQKVAKLVGASYMCMNPTIRMGMGSISEQYVQLSLFRSYSTTS